jgi:hypothetical protein
VKAEGNDLYCAATIGTGSHSGATLALRGIFVPHLCKESENSDQEPENYVSQQVLVGPSGGWVLGVATGWKMLEGEVGALVSNNHKVHNPPNVYISSDISNQIWTYI